MMNTETRDVGYVESLGKKQLVGKTVVASTLKLNSYRADVRQDAVGTGTRASSAQTISMDMLHLLVLVESAAMSARLQ